jgi:hypothetical protein
MHGEKGSWADRAEVIRNARGRRDLTAVGPEPERDKRVRRNGGERAGLVPHAMTHALWLTTDRRASGRGHAKGKSGKVWKKFPSYYEAKRDIFVRTKTIYTKTGTIHVLPTWKRKEHLATSL